MSAGLLCRSAIGREAHRKRIARMFPRMRTLALSATSLEHAGPSLEASSTHNAERHVRGVAYARRSMPCRSHAQRMAVERRPFHDDAASEPITSSPATGEIGTQLQNSLAKAYCAAAPFQFAAKFYLSFRTRHAAAFVPTNEADDEYERSARGESSRVVVRPVRRSHIDPALGKGCLLSTQRSRGRGSLDDISSRPSILATT